MVLAQLAEQGSSLAISNLFTVGKTKIMKKKQGDCPFKKKEFIQG